MPFSSGRGSRAALEGAPREQGGTAREHGGARGSTGEHWGAASEQRGAQQERRDSGSSKEPDLAAPYSATAARVIYPTVLPGLAYYCLYSYSFARYWLYLTPVNPVRANKRISNEPVP